MLGTAYVGGSQRSNPDPVEAGIGKLVLAEPGERTPGTTINNADPNRELAALVEANGSHRTGGKGHPGRRLITPILIGN